MPNTTAVSSEVSNGGASKPPLGIVIARREDNGDDDDNGEENVRTPIRPSAKALGKRRVVEVEDPDRKSCILVTPKFDR